MRPWTALSVFVTLVLALTALRLWSEATPRCPDGVCPRLETLTDYRPPEPPTLYDVHGDLFAHLDGETRLTVPLEEMPAALVQGFVAVEDRRFWSHGGIDVLGVVRAAVRNLASGGVREGASTLDMQLARNLWEPAVRDQNRWRRKITEARLSLALERRLPKERILELYLNQIYLGDGLYGVTTAALHYFGKRPEELSLSEIATIIGMTRTPERYNPREHPERARQRRDVVLGVLVRERVVDSAAAASARSEPVQTVPERTAPARRGGSYYAAAVARELRALVPRSADRNGLHVFTAYEEAVQHAVDRELAAALAAIESGRYGSFPHEVPGDTLPKAHRGASPFLQGAVVVLDLTNGAVQGLAGGRSFAHSEFDRALQAMRQPGSAFKPIVAAAALQRGASLASRFSTAPLEIATPEGMWAPRDPQSEGRRLDVRMALARSSNLAAVRLGQTAGVEHVVETARALGIDSPLPPVPSLFLGSAELHPAELTAAFAAFANGGTVVEPHLIRRIERSDGTLLYQRSDTARGRIDPRVAFLTRLALEDVVERGTGRSARTPGYRGSAAGKTGTTNAGRDVWFVGMTPDRVAGVWIGFDEPESILPGASGGRLAAPIWGGVMAEIYGDARPRWKEAAPEGLVRLPIDPYTGLVSSERCPSADPTLEYFIPGTEPDDLCSLIETRIMGAERRPWSGAPVLARPPADSTSQGEIPR